MRRRTFLTAGGATLLAPVRQLAAAPGGEAAVAARRADLRETMRAIEARTGGRAGLAVLDTGDGSVLEWRGGERFPMCSSFKAPLAAHALWRAERGLERLDAPVPVAQGDLLFHSPFSETRAGATATVAELARAAVVVSDNAAANLLLARGGGPAGLTRFLRGLGDPVTRLDRTEPALNAAVPGDPRDTSTPLAMAATLRSLLLGNVLAPASRATLTAWMVACETGAAKLRAGLPPTWRVADKTGAGEHGSDIDVALLLPPCRPPLVVVSYLHGSAMTHDQLAPVHAEVGGWIGRHLA